MKLIQTSTTIKHYVNHGLAILDREAITVGLNVFLSGDRELANVVQDALIFTSP